MKTLKTIILGVTLWLPLQASAMGSSDPLLTYVLFDELATNGTETEWKMDAWVGYDINKLYIKSDGIVTGGAVGENSTQLLYSHATSPYWDRQIGVRVDNKAGNQRSYIGIGYMGVAPYFLETDIGLFYGDNGQINFNLTLEHELMFTQRLVLITEYGLDINSQDDAAMEIGSGLSQQTLGFRLAYEVKREFAPYLGVTFNHYYGNTASFVVGGGGLASSSEVTVGVKMWF